MRQLRLQLLYISVINIVVSLFVFRWDLQDKTKTTRFTILEAKDSMQRYVVNYTCVSEEHGKNGH